jgi:hypothetical protein
VYFSRHAVEGPAVVFGGADEAQAVFGEAEVSEPKVGRLPVFALLLLQEQFEFSVGVGPDAADGDCEGVWVGLFDILKSVPNIGDALVGDEVVESLAVNRHFLETVRNRFAFAVSSGLAVVVSEDEIHEERGSALVAHQLLEAHPVLHGEQAGLLPLLPLLASLALLLVLVAQLGQDGLVFEFAVLLLGVLARRLLFLLGMLLVGADHGGEDVGHRLHLSLVS